MKTVSQIKKEQFEIQRAIRFLIDNCLNEKSFEKLKTKSRNLFVN